MAARHNDIAALQQKVVAFRDARDWKQFHNPKDLCISLVLEASELLEHFQWKNSDEMSKHLMTSQQDIGEERKEISGR